MKLIKAATVYKAEIPTDVDALHKHLAERAFIDPLEHEHGSMGFVPVQSDSDLLVETFPGGLAFRVRIDQKVLPSSVVKAETAKRAVAIEEDQGFKPGRKQLREIKELVIDDLVTRALVRTAASITCFYDIKSGYLIVPTTNSNITSICTNLLIKAVGSVKTETIHVSNVKHGLTARLKNWLSGDIGAFGPFEPCDQVALADSKGRKITVKMESLGNAREGLEEAMTLNFGVTSLGFKHGEVEFRLTDKFDLRGIHNPVTDEQVRDQDQNPWEADAMEQVGIVVGIVNELVELLSYKEDEA